MKYYYYKSKVGTFYIKQKKDDPKIFQLWIDDELLGSYKSPINAADEVYTQTTGYFEWDSLLSLIDIPNDLSEWEVVY